MAIIDKISNNRYNNPLLAKLIAEEAQLLAEEKFIIDYHKGLQAYRNGLQVEYMHLQNQHRLKSREAEHQALAAKYGSGASTSSHTETTTTTEKDNVMPSTSGMTTIKPDHAVPSTSALATFEKYIAMPSTSAMTNIEKDDDIQSASSTIMPLKPIPHPNSEILKMFNIEEDLLELNLTVTNPVIANQDQSAYDMEEEDDMENCEIDMNMLMNATKW